MENPGNNLYVTGLSHRITRKELEKLFSSEGTVWAKGLLHVIVIFYRMFK